MTRREKLLEGKPLSEVADTMANSAADSANSQMAQAEFLLRQTQFAERAAVAAENTALETARYTKYMLASVVVLALSACGTLLLQFGNLLFDVYRSFATR